MKVIFLDIDGVLNSRRYDLYRGDEDGTIDESRLPILKQIVDETDAKIVLTSTWRHHWDPDGLETDDVGAALEDTFEQYGISLYDKTSELYDRAEEIKAWLDEHPDTESFVIIDDIRFGWGKLDENLVNTDYHIGRGLEPEHAEKAIEILLKP